MGTKRPDFITEEIKEDEKICIGCKLVSKCMIIKFINQVAHSNKSDNLTDEFGCVYFEDNIND